MDINKTKRSNNMKNKELENFINAETARKIKAAGAEGFGITTCYNDFETGELILVSDYDIDASYIEALDKA